jgi:hypothetical protein
MADTKLRFTPLRPGEEDERFLPRSLLARRWNCSEKAVLRAEKRLGLHPFRLLREIRYRLTDVVRVETESLTKMPKKFTGTRPVRKDQKAELLPRARRRSSSHAETAPPRSPARKRG